MHPAAWALAVVLASPLSLAADDLIPVESVVAFHTQCDHCHEAECSGRMSLQLGADAADAHIRRHGGALPAATVRQLGELLRNMKERCAFYPMPLALAADRTWGTDTLRRLRAPDGTAYFLPLGQVAPGIHLVWMDGLEPDATATAELIAADFERLADEGITREAGRELLQFRTEVPAELYLRIRARAPMTLLRVELVSSPFAGPASTPSKGAP